MGRIVDGSEIVPCHYCQREVGPGRLEFTRDHVVPRALGGRDRRDNVVPSCRDCNGEKADKYPTHKCGFCNRTRRRHWEEFGINAESVRKRKRPTARQRQQQWAADGWIKLPDGWEWVSPRHQHTEEKSS